MKSAIVFKSLLLLCALNLTPCLAADRGILITPDANGNYEYIEDFDTARFLIDAFGENITVDCWQPGVVQNAGPVKKRTLIYRFYGDQLITGIDINVKQRATKNLGSRNNLYLSTNGIDWIQVASSDDLEPDTNIWRTDPLLVSAEQAAQFTGHNQLWVRVELENYSGAKTGTSNYVENLEVKLEVGDPAVAEADPQADLRADWGKLRQQADWKTITLDWADPIDNRPPHYYEDSDGWLQSPGANPYLITDSNEGFPIRRKYLGHHSLVHAAPSMAMFVKTARSNQPLMARIIVHADRDACRKATVSWDGKILETIDTASFFETEKVFFVKICGPQHSGIHELRIAGQDSKPILVRQIAIAGSSVKTFAEKPPLPSEGKLKLLSAYYIPDPKPPVNSQAVGRGQNYLYEEHADFGGIRMVMQNTSSVPVRVSQILFNGKPIEESYINLEKPDKDIKLANLRGVVWHRVRPKLLEPGQCGQIFIRFRRRPVGQLAEVTIKLENGKPVTTKVPYEDPGLLIDYVTTGEPMDTLYVYVRRSANAKPERVTSLTFDGKPVKDAKIYGSDFPGNVALITAKLAQPLKVGDYHIVGVETNTKKRVDAQFRVMPFMYMRNSIATPLHLIKQMNMNLAAWNEISLEACEKYDIVTTTQWNKTFDLHRRIIFTIGLDEPDAQYDKKGGRGPGALGLHARQATRENGWLELMERHAPKIPTWFMLNHSSRPHNWAIYGQLGDILSSDPYPCTWFDADHTMVRECLSMTRLSSRPHRMYATLEAYGWKWSKQAGIPKDGRGPSPAEYRQNLVQAIGVGMKGLTSWVYPAHNAGWQLNDPNAKAVAEEIKKTNKLIEYIEDKLLIGTPIDLATSDAGLTSAGPFGNKKWLKDKVWVSSLLCGPDTIIITAANHIPAQLPDPPTTVTPAKDVTITVQLPGFLQNVIAFEVTEDGLTPFDCNVKDSNAYLKLNAIESGRVFVLQRK